MSKTSAKCSQSESGFKLFKRQKAIRQTEFELQMVLENLQYYFSPEEIKNLKNVIVKRNGRMDVEAFQKLINEKVSKEDEERELMIAFMMLDSDKDGYLTYKEISAAMTHLDVNLTEAEILDMIYSYDKDGDGRMNYYEFIKFMTS